MTTPHPTAPVRPRRNTTHRPFRWHRLLPPIAALLVVSACAASPSQNDWRAPITAGQQLYVSIGDSYAAGYQPSPGGGGATSRNGFAYQLTNRLTTAGHAVRLFNFGCSGMTSTQVLHSQGCVPGALGPGTPPYQDGTQAQSADTFLTAHRAQVALVTVVVGGNDLERCLQSPSGALQADQPCIGKALTTLRTNLSTLLKGIRQAVGPSVPVVGLTYPDVYLASYLSPAARAQSLPQASVVLFRDQLNPLLRSIYTAAGAHFVDITQDSGAYQPFSSSTVVPPYGTIPTPVASICALTYYCSLKDVHPTVQGHALIAAAVMKAVDP